MGKTLNKPLIEFSDIVETLVNVVKVRLTGIGFGSFLETCVRG